MQIHVWKYFVFFPPFMSTRINLLRIAQNKIRADNWMRFYFIGFFFVVVRLELLMLSRSLLLPRIIAEQYRGPVCLFSDYILSEAIRRSHACGLVEFTFWFWTLPNDDRWHREFCRKKVFPWSSFSEKKFVWLIRSLCLVRYHKGESHHISGNSWRRNDRWNEVSCLVPYVIITFCLNFEPDIIQRIKIKLLGIDTLAQVVIVCNGARYADCG